MNLSLFEYKLNELDRHVLATCVANKNGATLRFPRLATVKEPRTAPGAPFIDEDDLLFDNVPI